MSNITKLADEIFDQIQNGLSKSDLIQLLNDGLDKWTNINDKLPPLYTPVLVKFGKFQTVAWRASDENGRSTYTTWGTDHVISKKITCWKNIDLD